MAEVVYALCALLSIACFGLLIRAYRGGRTRLLLWTSLCFLFLAINNAILFVDNIVLPDVDFGGALLRNLTGAVAGALLLFGLLWEVT